MLTITHGDAAGFFSCCSDRMNKLVAYFNSARRLPEMIDGTGLFLMYKRPQDAGRDVTGDFFSPAPPAEEADGDPETKIVYGGHVPHDPFNYQFSNYCSVNYAPVLPFVRRYFAPAPSILNRSMYFRDKYAVRPEACLAVYYRGTDKWTETRLENHGTFVDRIEAVLADADAAGRPYAQILLQTDTAQFKDHMVARHESSRWRAAVTLLSIQENETSHTDGGLHFERRQTNYADVHDFFATVLVLAQCRGLICSTSNVCIWMMYYRGGAAGVHQNLNGTWHS